VATIERSANAIHVLKGAAFVIGGALIALSSFALGRITAPQPMLQSRAEMPRIVPVQDPQAPGLGQQQTPQELIPLPGPGQQTPGQQPGPPVPGQGQQPGNCPVYIYQDGKLYQFPAPGQQPGQQPGQGNGPGPGTPGGPQELIPLGPGGPGGNPGNPTPNLPPSLPQQPTAPPAPNNRS
jgi:hypothetical protein